MSGRNRDCDGVVGNGGEGDNDNEDGDINERAVDPQEYSLGWLGSRLDGKIYLSGT